MATKKGLTTNFFYPSLLLLCLVPGSEMDKHPGSATLVGTTYFQYIYILNNKLLESHKTAEIRVFLIFCLLLQRSGSVQIIKDPDFDPGGPKTYGTG